MLSTQALTLKRKSILCNKKGFTLTELIIVIAIIAILAAILIPTFISLRERSVQRAALATGRNIMTAYEAMKTDGITIDEESLSGEVRADAKTFRALTTDGAVKIKNVTADFTLGFEFLYQQGSGKVYEVKYVVLTGSLTAVASETITEITYTEEG